MRSALSPTRDQLPFSIQTSDVINGQLVPISRREAWAPVAWGPTPGQAGGFAPVPTIPPAVGSGSFGVMDAQAPGFTAGMGGASSAANATVNGAGNMSAAGVAGLYPWNWKLSPLPLAIIFLIVGLIGLRMIHWK